MEGPLQRSETVLRFEQPLKFIKSLPKCFYKRGGCSTHFVDEEPEPRDA